VRYDNKNENVAQ